MNTSLGKRLVSLLLTLVMVLGLVPAGIIPNARAEEISADDHSDIVAYPGQIDNPEYIDLPIEVLDFRGDGFLFEASDCWNTPYSLAYRSPASITLSMSDEDFARNQEKYGGDLSKTANKPFGVSGSGEASIITGLVSGTLVDGKLLYTEDTLIYIAYAIQNKDSLSKSDMLNDMNKQYDPNQTVRNDTVWFNKTFMDKARLEGMELGSPEATYEKFSTLPLIWRNVETSFDMAYYLLYYVWNPVQETDYLDTLQIGDTTVYGSYNVKVPELSKIRLYRTTNSSGESYYSVNAEYIEDVWDGCIYCTSTDTALENSIRNDSMDNPCPYFRPVENLGFEKYFVNEDGTPKQMHPINTTGGWNMQYTSSNFLFTMHASGGFVYNEESNFFFEFMGDDDVYFFINDELIVDLGGIHNKVTAKCYLNDYAKDLKLEDGQICSFDMYFADRHTTGVNMMLSTNIELMDYDLLTQKKQFDARTGLEYANGQAVPYGTPIDYQFSILNRKTLPASEVSFVDENLGVELTHEKIKVSGSTEYVGSAEISGEGLEVIYRPYNDDGSLVTEGMVTVDSLEALRSSIAPFTEELTLVEGEPPRIRTPYRYAVKTAEELETILGIGVPGYCELAVYGIERTLQKAGSATGDRIILANSNHIYSNTLRSTARPGTIQGGEANVTVFYASPVNGISTCRIKGFDMGDVSAVEPLRIVVDYGKDVDIRLSALADGADYKKVDYSLEYVGMELPAENEAASKMGLVTKTLPKDLLFTAVGDTVIQGENGSFTRTTDEAIRFTMDGFLEAVERAYAVLSVTPLNDPESGAPTTGNEIIGYIYVEFQIIPANMMYYEAEDFTNEITLTKKTTDEDTGIVTTQTTWENENYKTEGTSGGVLQTTSSAGEPVVIPDYSDRTDVLFFGFDNTDADAKRYQLPQYNGTNFDRITWGSSTTYAQSTTIDNGVFTATGKAMGANATVDSGTSVAIHPDNSHNGNMIGNNSKKALNFNPSNAEVYQIRFKMKGFHPKYDTTGKEYIPYLGLHIWAESKNGEGFQFGAASRCMVDFQFDKSVLNKDEYMTWTILLGREFDNVKTMWGIRTYFGNTWCRVNAGQTLGTLTIDYIYIGPAEDAPLPTTYGYDESYDKDGLLSNGKSLYVEGTGVRAETAPNPANYTEVEFAFTGTGFDLISRTNKDQTSIRIWVYTDEARTQPVPGACGDQMLWGQLGLYQIPVVSIQDLTYGTYYVTIGVANKVEYDSPFLQGLNHGNQFYFDALRIYDPIDVSAGASATESDAKTAYAAYCADREAHPYIKEVRDILLSAKDFHALQGQTQGAIFVDYEKIPQVNAPVIGPDGETTGATENVTDPSLGVTDHITTNVLTYEKVGPNNEVYLGPQQLIAFKLLVYTQELPQRLDVGCKLIDGTTAIFSGTLLKSASHGTGIFEIPIHSSTIQYYSIPVAKEAFTKTTDKDGRSCYAAYVIIQNKSDKVNSINNVLSITDIKAAYSSAPTPLAASVAEQWAATRNGEVELPEDTFLPLDFVVDGDLQGIVEELLQEETLEEPCTHIPGEWEIQREALPGQEGLKVRYCTICGALCETEIIASVGQIAFAGASVSLQSDLAINYKVDEAFFTELGYTEPYVVIEDNGTRVILREYEIREGKYVFVYRNIAPHRIGDTVTATLYAYYGEELYCSQSRDYSVADYCYNMLGKTEGIAAYDKLRTLLVDILLYGAKTQEYMSYRLDSLCTARLTEAQLACGTAECRELVNHKDQAYETIENPEVQWKGAGLNLRESVAIRFKIEAESYEDLVVKITVAGKTYSIYAKDFDHRADGTYVHFKTINAAQMSEPVYAAVYRGGEQVSHTICYSIESYAYSKQNDSIPHLADLVKRMMCYGDSTKAYVG